MPFNPTTQRWEDDKGNPVPAPPGAPAPAPAVPAPLFGPKPEHESTTVVENRIMSPASEEARKNVALATGGVANAQDAVTDVKVEEAGRAATAASDEAALLTDQKNRQWEADQAEKRERDAWLADQKRGVEEDAAAKRKAGAARADYWKGNEAGEVAVALFRGIQEGAQAYQGRSGPTGVERIVEAKMDAHERKLVGEYEATAEARRLKKENYQEWERGRALVRIAAEKQNAAELATIRSHAEAFAKQLGPEKERAIGALSQKLEQLGNARLDQKLAAEGDQVFKRSTTNRDPTAGRATGAANRQLTNETIEAATAAADLERLAADQSRLIAKNGGDIPVTGADAADFETNQRAMAAALQKQFGKSDNDAILASKMEGAPTTWGKVWSQVPGVKDLDAVNPVLTYQTIMANNVRRSKAHAQTRIDIENKTAGASATAALGGRTPSVTEQAAANMGMKSPAAAGDGEVKTYKDKKGRVFQGIKQPDGKIREVQ